MTMKILLKALRGRLNPFKLAPIFNWTAKSEATSLLEHLASYLYIRHMKINNKSKVANISSDMQHSCSVLMCGYFSSGNGSHSGSIRAIWRRRMMENMLANEPVIFLNVPNVQLSIVNSQKTIIEY